MDTIKVVPPEYKSSHKYGHDPLVEALHMASLESWQNDEAGESDGPVGWNAVFHFEHDENVEIPGGPVTDPWVEATITVPKGSYVLTEDSQGFVYAVRYDYKSAEVE